MIKINLLKTVAVSNDAGMDTRMEAAAFESGADNELLVKFLIIASCTLLLVGYEFYNIDRLTSESKAQSARLAAIQAEIAQLKPEADKVREFADRNKEVEQKINKLKTLSKLRLNEIKTLDALQNIIPDNVWLSRISYTSSAFNLSGYSVTQAELNTFLQSLEQSQFFKNPELRTSQEVKVAQGSVKQFEIVSSIGGDQ